MKLGVVILVAVLFLFLKASQAEESSSIEKVQFGLYVGNVPYCTSLEVAREVIEIEASYGLEAATAKLTAFSESGKCGVEPDTSFSVVEDFYQKKVLRDELQVVVHIVAAYVVFSKEERIGDISITTLKTVQVYAILETHEQGPEKLDV